MIDLHCHILCNLDDGPGSMDETVAMAAIAVDDGIHTIVATPHTLNGMYDNTFDRIVHAVRQTQDVLSQNSIPLNLAPGGENYFCDGLSEKILDGCGCFINGNGRYALVEFPFHTLPVCYKKELFALRKQGVVPIIAHPERCLPLQQDFELVAELVEMGCIVQLTAMSVTGDFGKITMRCAHKLLREHLIHVVASDAHSPENRTPVLSPALEMAAEVLQDNALAKTLFSDNPRDILEGRNIASLRRIRLNTKRTGFSRRIKAFLNA